MLIQFLKSILAPKPTDSPSRKTVNTVENSPPTLEHKSAEYNSLGNQFFTNGDFDKAEQYYRQALTVNPLFSETYNHLGLVHKKKGNFDQAASCFQKAIELQCNYAEPHYNLGDMLDDFGKFDEAIACYRKALAIQPDYVKAHNSLGVTLYAQGKLNEAISCYRKAIAIDPCFVKAYNNLGAALHHQGKLKEATDHYHKATELNPYFAEAHNNLGNTLAKLGLRVEAAESYRKAIEAKTDYSDACYNLGIVLNDLGQTDDAAATYCRALEIKPDFPQAYSNLLYLYAFSRNIPPESECSLASKWEHSALKESERIAARNRQFAFPHSARPHQKLRIGVVSAEIGQHPVADFLEPILEQINRDRFHITLYPTFIRTDPRAAKFKALADQFKPIDDLSDDQAADLIRSDEIDILIDTTSHMRGCRLGIFARRAAPVQCHYIGYHGTTGLTEMDWFIADSELLPLGYEAHFRERIWRLPCLRLAYKYDLSLPESHWTPNPDGTIWLGSFNNLTKVREQALGLWARVMNALPESKLYLKDSKALDPANQMRIRTELARHGIGEERIMFVGTVPDWPAHMILYDQLDIALDSIPLNSETTAFDALWMGVPIIALEGNWVGGRMASTLLKAIGKTEWVAQNEDDYVAKVVALARDIAGRTTLRADQRTLMKNSPLCDAKQLAKALEDAFEEMLAQWTERAEKSAENS
jgi:predicted O-linked N-acetylglucosamine transferase (SPINDLY family)